MSRERRNNARGLAAFAFVLLSSLHSGCLTTQTHQSAYYHHDGMWCATFAIGPGEARVATLTALSHLKMRVYLEGPYRRGTFIDTRTPDHLDARIIIMPPGRSEPGTRISVRIGEFDMHRDACERLLDEITREVAAVQHLDPARATPVSAPSVAMPVPSQATTAPQQPQASGASLPPQPVAVDR